MFSDNVTARLKEIVKQRGTTMASVAEALVVVGLEHADLDALNLAPAKKRGRKKPAIAVPPAETVQQ